MDKADYIEAIETHGGRLADAAERAGLAAPVPSCPGWTVLDLVRHTVGVCDFWEADASGADPADFVPRDELAPDEAIPACRSIISAVAATLGSLSPDAPAWTWAESQTAGFVQRRMAQELAVHAWDATLAAGDPQPIEAPLAADGVDEYLEVFAPMRPGHADGESLTGHLHATDVDGEWYLRTGAGEWSIERTHAKGDVAVRGAAHDLLLLVWGRTSIDGGAFEVFGEPAKVADLLTRVAMS